MPRPRAVILSRRAEMRVSDYHGRHLMFTRRSRTITHHLTSMIVGTALLVCSGLVLSPFAAAKEKYTVDPVTGTKYKAEPEMKDLLVALT